MPLTMSDSKNSAVNAFSRTRGLSLVGLAGVLCLGAALSACGPSPKEGAPDKGAAPTTQNEAKPSAELPPMPGARPAEAPPQVDPKLLEKAVAQEMEKQAREIREGVREAEQSRPLFPEAEAPAAAETPVKEAKPASR